jgi:hypothetical protein
MLPRPMARRRSLPLAALLAALAVAGCGSKSSDEKAVKQTVKDVYAALAEKDAKKVCQSISKKGKDEITGSAAKAGRKQSCEQLFSLGLAFAGDSLKQAKNVKVTDVNLDGDTAKATISLQNRKSDIGLVKENGDWKLSGLDLNGG